MVIRKHYYFTKEPSGYYLYDSKDIFLQSMKEVALVFRVKPNGEAELIRYGNPKVINIEKIPTPHNLSLAEFVSSEWDVKDLNRLISDEDYASIFHSKLIMEGNSWVVQTPKKGHIFRKPLPPKASEKKYSKSKMSKRAWNWLVFAKRVWNHIEQYTVPQYGDAPDDQVEAWTVEDCLKAIRKYTSRFGSNARQGQEQLDLLKIAHYASIALEKLEGKKDGNNL